MCPGVLALELVDVALPRLGADSMVPVLSLATRGALGGLPLLGLSVQGTSSRIVLFYTQSRQ